MADKFTKQKRSLIMASIKSKNNLTELAIRKKLFAEGLRYRLHNKKLPGSPDLTFKKYNAVIFINGCFWHQHNCPAANLPKSNQIFWTQKLQNNALRDKINLAKLNKLGWRIKILWSCELKKKSNCIKEIVDWIKDDKYFFDESVL